MYSTSASISSVVNQSMPMAAMFLRNKFLGWFALLQSVHFLFNTSKEERSLHKSTNANPNPLDQSPLLRIVLCIIGLCVCYLNIVFPQQTI